MAEHLETRFLTTPWTLIVHGDESRADRATDALVRLCESYRYPVYAFIRSKMEDPEGARDLAQGFFEHVIEKKIYRLADRERGRFRTFLLAAVKNFLINAARDESRQKRAGGKIHILIDSMEAEKHFSQLSEAATPDKRFDQEWAVAVFDRVWALLRAEYKGRSHEAHFESLRASLMMSDDATPYSELAQQLGLSEPGVRSAIHRMRQRFRELFHEVVAQLTENPAEIDEEIRYLVEAMAAR